MKGTGARLLKDALALPVEERARLASELMASVDGAPDKESEAAWAAEIERREARAVRGNSRGRNWSDAIRDIEKNLPRR